MANLSITAANVLFVSGSKETLTAAETITAGQLLYKDANSQWKLAQADGTFAEATIYAIALDSGSTNQPVTAQTDGVINLGTGTQGEIYIASATAGAICPEADISTTGYFVSIVGVGIGSNQLKLLFSSDTASKIP
jgi:hypothetical protein